MDQGKRGGRKLLLGCNIQEKNKTQIKIEQIRDDYEFLTDNVIFEIFTHEYCICSILVLPPKYVSYFSGNCMHKISPLSKPCLTATPVDVTMWRGKLHEVPLPDEEL